MPAGVYFYVINARGSDGVEYKRAGDINVTGLQQPARAQARATGRETTE